MAQNLRPGPDWIAGTIVERLGPLSYLVEMETKQFWKRHADHLKEVSDSTLKQTEFEVVPDWDCLDPLSDCLPEPEPGPESSEPTLSPPDSPPLSTATTTSEPAVPATPAPSTSSPNSTPATLAPFGVPVRRFTRKRKPRDWFS